MSMACRLWSFFIIAKPSIIARPTLWTFTYGLCFPSANIPPHCAVSRDGPSLAHASPSCRRRLCASVSADVRGAIELASSAGHKPSIMTQRQMQVVA